jgi:hypothetical protein
MGRGGLGWVLPVAVAASLVACGGEDGSDEQESTANRSEIEVTTDVATVCKKVGDSGAALVKSQSGKTRRRIQRDLGAAQADAEDLGSRIDALDPGRLKEELNDAADAAEEAADELADVARNPTVVGAQGSAKLARNEVEACYESLGLAVAEIVDGVLLERLRASIEKSRKTYGTVFVKLVGEIAKLEQRATAGPSRGETNDLPSCYQAPPPCRAPDGSVRETGPGPGGGETADLPSCDEAPAPCRRPDGSVRESGPGPGGGEAADLPTCAEAPPPCRNPDGSVQEP